MIKKSVILLLMAIVLSACSSAEDKEKEVIGAYLTAKYTVTPDTTLEQVNTAIAPYVASTVQE